ncbi:MAG: sel1 repeat family protein [Ectothiorhodospiraceae bacterium]|nr:sel1 repeat family protein [Ectothiorhodospiraceae bacterium]
MKNKMSLTIKHTKNSIHMLMGLGLLIFLSACSSTPVNTGSQPNTVSRTSTAEMQEQLTEGKSLFLKKQYKEAAVLLLPLARQGDIDAQYSVGYMYHYGYGLPRNEKESTRWIATAAARGHLIAQEALARIDATHGPGGVIAE